MVLMIDDEILGRNGRQDRSSHCYLTDLRKTISVPSYHIQSFYQSRLIVHDVFLQVAHSR